MSTLISGSRNMFTTSADMHGDGMQQIEPSTSTEFNKDDYRFPKEDAMGHARKRSSFSASGTTDKRAATKICRVCGDRAYSYNFNVITCESCKAFFRRNANKEKEIRCPFNNCCDINIVSRRFCQRCRLEKCFKVGMKKEWIMSEEARLEKKQRVQENRERRLAEVASTVPFNKKNTIVPKTGGTMPVSSTDPIQATACPQPPASLLPSLPALTGEPMPLGVAMGAAVADAIANKPPVPFPGATFPNSTFRAQVSDSAPGNDQRLASQVAQQVQFAQAQLQQAAQIEHQWQQQTAAQKIVQQQAAQLVAAQAQQQQLAAAAAVVAASKNLISPSTAAAVAPMQAALNVANQLDMLDTLNKQFTQLGQTQNTPITPVSSSDGDTVTIPKDVYEKLIEHKHMANPTTEKLTSSSYKCTCTCQCGKYHPGAIIVDELVAELTGIGTTKMESDDLCDSFSSSPIVVDCKPDVDNAVQKKETFSPGEQKPIFYTDEDSNESKIYPDLSAMTVEEHNRLQEVIQANKVWAEMDNIDNARHQKGTPSKIEMVNMADGAIRRMIRMINCFENFKKIDHHDQIQLMKNTCMEYIILRGAMSYDPVHNNWAGPTPSSGFQIKMDALKDTQSNLFENSIRFYSTFKEEWRRNEEVMLVLGMIVVFNPEIENLHGRDFIREENRQYKRVLKKLLFSLCNKNQKKTIVEYKGLMDILTNLKFMDLRAQQMLHEVDTNAMEPLLREIFYH